MKTRMHLAGLLVTWLISSSGCSTSGHFLAETAGLPESSEIKALRVTTNYRESGLRVRTVWDANVTYHTQNSLGKRVRWHNFVSYSIIAIGAIGGAVVAGLAEQDADNVAYAMTIATAGLGIAQLAISPKKEHRDYIDQSTTAITAWDTSKMDAAAYSELLNDLRRIRATYAELCDFSIPPPVK